MNCLYSKGIFMKKLFSVFALASLAHVAFAAYHQAPPAFDFQNDKAVFVDFDHADYIINYDVANKTVDIETTIEFYAEKEGHPIFDVVSEPSLVSIDGVETTAP